MATLLAGEVRDRTPAARRFSLIYGAVLLLALHWALVVYINSSLLEQFVSSEALGALYTVGSALTLIVFLFIAQVLRRFGNYRLTLALATLECTALIGLAFAESLRVAVPLFLAHQALVPLILFNLDVFAERAVGEAEQITGGTRGAVLLCMGLAGAFAPLAAGLLVTDSEPRFRFVYLASAALVCAFMLFVWRNFRFFADAPYTDIRFFDLLRCFWAHPNLRFIFLAHLLLQIFFIWMVVYLPLYLATVIGFSWSQIGSILFVALLGYVLCEYPAGKLADRIGEVELMVSGFLILAASVSLLAFLGGESALPWMAALFATRIGASLVEVASESYFFKQTGAASVATVSFFRASRPLAAIAGTLLGSLALLYLPFGYAFLVLAVLMVPGISLALSIEDTR